MISKTLYMCERCCEKYDTEKEALDCENFHRELNEILHCTEFEITEQHLRLLQKQRVKWKWCEYGASEIDPKRPYGNGFVEDDMAKILDIKGDIEYEDGSEDYSEEQKKMFWKLHIETTVALQICLSLMKFESGKYIKVPSDWIVGKWEQANSAIAYA